MQLDEGLVPQHSRTAAASALVPSKTTSMGCIVAISTAMLIAADPRGDAGDIGHSQREQWVRSS
jgi:hypothetical protein